MAYPKRDWANTGNEVTKEDFKRIENGIEANDIEITKQKNPTIPGTLAKQIADNVTAIEENANKINVLNEVIDRQPTANPSSQIDLKLYLARMKKHETVLLGNKINQNNIINIPVQTSNDYICTVSGGFLYGNMYYAKLTCSSLLDSTEIYECTVYNGEMFTEWERLVTTKMLNNALAINNLTQV